MLRDAVPQAVVADVGVADPVGGETCLHASCVAVSGAGVVLVGPSGSGKSDVALRLIDAGGRLIAESSNGAAGTCSAERPRRLPASSRPAGWGS
jgi:HPr kinase/phosphorylase